MKKLIFLFTLLSVSTYAQMNFVFQWVNPLMSSTGNGVGEAVVVDSNGDVYTTGGFLGQLNFNPLGTSSLITSSGTSAHDAYVAKYNSAGSLIWAFKLGSSGLDWAYGLGIDNSGNLIVCGKYTGTVDFDPSSSVANLIASNTDIFIAKYSSSGSYIWAAGIGGAGGGIANEIAIDANNNIYTTGYFGGTIDFDPGVGSYSITAIGTGDAFISKLSSTGAFVWAKGFGGTSITNGSGIAVDNSGNLYASGQYYGTVDFDPGIGTFNSTSAGSSDLYVSKFDPSGNFMWTVTTGNTSLDNATSVTIDKSGNVLVTGYFSGTVDFDPSSSPSNLISNGNKDIFIWKLSPAASLIWVKSVGSTAVDDGFFITTDQERNVYTTGDFSGTSTDFDPGTGVASWSAPNSNVNSFILKLDSAGNYRASLGLGGNGSDYGQAIAVDANYSVYSTGVFQQTTDFNPQGTAYSVNPPNGSTPYLHKICQTPESPSAIIGNTITCLGSSSVFSIAAVPHATSYVWSNVNAWTGSSTSLSITLTPTALASTGTISVSSSNACGSSNAFTLGIKSVSVPTISVNSGTVCSGQLFTLMPSGASSYTYSSGSSIVTPTINTTYQVVGTNSLGCISPTAAVASITVYALPTIAVSGGTICNGNTFTLVPSGAATYTYSSGTNTVAPSSTTTYSIVGTSSVGCITNNPALVTVTVFAYPMPTITANGGVICQGETFTISPTGAVTYTFSGGSATVTPATTTTYYVSGTNLQGCQTITQTALTVTVLPSPSVILNNGEICIGENFTIAPTGAVSYTFLNGGPIVSPTITTSYSVTSTGSNGCESEFPNVTTVTVNPLPNVSVTPTNSFICNGDVINLAASGAMSYSWSTGESVSTITTTATPGAIYTITATNAKGCIANYVYTLSVNECLGLMELDSETTVNIFPNPSNGSSEVLISSSGSIQELVVINSLGQNILSSNPNQKIIKIDLRTLSGGVYYIRLSTNKSEIVKKLIVE